MKHLRNKYLLSSIILLVITFGAYQQVLWNEFVDIDDPKLIYENNVVSDPDTPISECFKKNIYNPHYKPLTFLSWRLEYMLVGEKPFLFHLNNLLLHMGCVVLVFFIGRKLFSRFFGEGNKVFASSFLFALLFALHPMHVESVAWATERKDVLFSFFFLCSWLVYFTYLEKKKYFLMVLVAVLYFLSMMSKSMGITLIAVLFLTDFLYKRKLGFKLLLEKIPVIVVALLAAYLFGLLTDFASKHTAGLTFVTTEGQASNYDTLNLFSPYVRRIVVIFLRFTLWLAHVFVPIKSALIYPKNDILDFFGKSLIVFPILIAAIYSSILFFHKRIPALFWGLVFFAITISPAIAISDTGTAVFLPDRYLYIPLMGILFFLVVGAMKFYAKYKKAVVAAMAVVCIWYAWITFDLVKVWENTGTLWTRPIELYSCNAEIINARANYYKSIGENNKFIEDINAAIDCDPTLPQPYYNRAMHYFNQKEFKKAVDDFNSFVKYKTWGLNAEVFSNRGAALFSMGEHEKALADYDKAIERDSTYFFVYRNRAVTLKTMNRHEEAIKDWTTCIQFRPGNYQFYTERGIAYFSISKFKDAVGDFTKAIELKPEDGSLFLRRSYCYFRLKMITEAKQDANKSKELGHNVRPDYFSALNRM